MKSPSHLWCRDQICSWESNALPVVQQSTHAHAQFLYPSFQAIPPLPSLTLLSDLHTCIKAVSILLCWLFLQKQISTLNELASNLVDMVTTAREDWEGEQSSGVCANRKGAPKYKTACKNELIYKKEQPVQKACKSAFFTCFRTWQTHRTQCVWSHIFIADVITISHLNAKLSILTLETESSVKFSSYDGTGIIMGVW